MGPNSLSTTDLKESILCESEERFTMFPIKYPQVRELDGMCDVNV